MSSAIKHNSKCGLQVMDLIFIDFQGGGRNWQLPTCLKLVSIPLSSSAEIMGIHYILMYNMLLQIKYFHKYLQLLL